MSCSTCTALRVAFHKNVVALHVFMDSEAVKLGIHWSHVGQSVPDDNRLAIKQKAVTSQQHARALATLEPDRYLGFSIDCSALL